MATGRIAPILTTLATLSIFTGLALRVLPVPGGSIPPSVRLVLTNPNVPTGLIWLAVAIAGWLVLRRTRFGMRIYAIGSDETSARAVGVPVVRVKVGVYALSGLCSALAAVFYVSTTTAGDANAGDAVHPHLDRLGGGRRGRLRRRAGAARSAPSPARSR